MLPDHKLDPPQRKVCPVCYENENWGEKAREVFGECELRLCDLHGCDPSPEDDQ